MTSNNTAQVCTLNNFCSEVRKCSPNVHVYAGSISERDDIETRGEELRYVPDDAPVVIFTYINRAEAEHMVGYYSTNPSYWHANGHRGGFGNHSRLCIYGSCQQGLWHNMIDFWYDDLDGQRKFLRIFRKIIRQMDHYPRVDY